MFFLVIFFTVLVVLFFVVMFEMMIKGHDDKEYHVTEDLTMVVLKNNDNFNDGCCLHCYYTPTGTNCPVDEQNRLKCDKKDEEVGKYSNHIWERVS